MVSSNKALLFARLSALTKTLQIAAKTVYIKEHKLAQRGGLAP